MLSYIHTYIHTYIRLHLHQFLKVAILIYFGGFFYFANAQEVRVIDNKGTLKNINKVTKNDTGAKPTDNLLGGDVYIDEKNGQVFIYNGKTNDWESFTQYWSLKGNTLSGTTAETDKNFLGTINDVKLQLRSDNQTLLQLGKRSKLYTSTNHDRIVNIRNGGSSYSTIEFQADGITTGWGKPMIRANNDTFMIRSGIPNSDYFEISTGGVGTDDGTLDFTMGDDGNEAFRFYGFSNTLGGKIELFRAQGSLDGNALTKPRFGINMNGNMANSTLQVEGSFSTAIKSGSANLQEEHHTVILSNASDNVTLPAPSTVKGRIYIIRNSTNTSKTIGGGFGYRGLYETSGATNNTIIPNSVLKLQSDGTNWVMINNRETITSLTQNQPGGSTPLDPTTYTTAGDITYTRENNTTQTANVVSSNAGNSIKVGTDGGAYLNLSELTHMGYFILSFRNNVTRTKVITGLPFKPSKIKFTAYPNLHGNTHFDRMLEGEGGSSGNYKWYRIRNQIGSSTGFVQQQSNGTLTQQMISYAKPNSGGSYRANRFASNSHVVGFHFGNNGGLYLGQVEGKVISLDSNGFTIETKFYYTTDTNRWGYSIDDRNTDYNLLVMYTAYR